MRYRVASAAIIMLSATIALTWFALGSRGERISTTGLMQAADVPAQPPKIPPSGKSHQEDIGIRPGPLQASAAKAAATPMDANEILRLGNEATLRRLHELDARYREIPSNSYWASSRKTAIDTLVNTDIQQVAGMLPAAYESNCRDRVCRIQADFVSANSDDWGDMLTAGLAQVLPKTRMLILRNTDGSTRIVMYAMERSVGL